MVIHEPELGEGRRQEHVGRLPGQPAAGDAHLHDLDAGGHDAHQGGQARPFVILVVLAHAQPGQDAARPSGFALLRPNRRLEGAAHGGGTEIHGDDQVRTHGPAQGDRHGIHQPAIHQEAPIVGHRGEQPRQGDGGAHGVGDAPLPQPQLAPRLQVGGHRREGQRQVAEVAVDEVAFEELDQLRPLDEPAVQADVEQGDDVLPGQRRGPRLQLVQVPLGVGRADEGPHGAAADDVGHDPFLGQGANDADMGPAAGGTAAEDEADLRFALSGHGYPATTSA